MPKFPFFTYIKSRKQNMEKFCDAVFEGGGVRGIGYVGAIAHFEKMGYQFRNIAGASAGAIVASLLAAGYTADEMRAELEHINFEKLKQPYFKTNILGIGALGALINTTKNFGMYNADNFEAWLHELLARKGVYTFEHLHGRLQLVATDVTDENTIVLPRDLGKYGIVGEKFSVATAVRMSMSIPAFYSPYELTDRNGNIHYIVDGGMLANYPIWCLDGGGSVPDIPVFGFRFIHYAGQIKSKKPSVITYAKQILTTLIEANDHSIKYMIRGDEQRTIYIDTMIDGKNIGITDFAITHPQVLRLYENGMKSAEQFLASWDFKNWCNVHRK